MKNWDGMIKTISGEVFTIVLRVVGYTIFAVVLNVILLVVQWDLAWSALASEEPITQRVDSILLLVGVVGFPVIFFILGQKQAIQNALSNLLKTKKNDLVLFLISKVYEKHPEIFDPAGKVPLRAIKSAEYLTETMRDLPLVIVKVLRYFMDKTVFYDLFSNSLEEYRKRADDTSEKNRVQVVSEILSNVIPGDVIRPDIKYPLIALVINVSLFFL